MTQVSARSYLTAGIAVLGAGAVALSPMQPITAPTAPSPVAAQAMAVNLAASIDPITPIINTVTTTISNASTLITNWLAQPFPILAQVANNWMYYFTELPNIGAILGQVFGNVRNLFSAPFDPGTLNASGIANGDNISTIPVTTVSLFPGTSLPFSQKNLWDTLLADFPPETLIPLAPVLNFLNTPFSGTLLGLAGPVIAPFVALGNGVTGAIAALQTQDWATAINDLINIPTNMINAALNGGVTLNVNLGALLPGATVGLALGGLLTTFTSTIIGVNPPTPIGTVQVGGVGFDSLAIEVTVVNPVDPGLPPVTISDPGIGIGLVGAMINGTRNIAGAINSVPTAAPAATRRTPAAASVVKRAGKPRAAAARHAR